MRVSTSQLSLNPFAGDASTRSSSDIRRSLAAFSNVDDSSTAKDSIFEAASAVEEPDHEEL